MFGEGHRRITESDTVRLEVTNWDSNPESADSAQQNHRKAIYVRLRDVPTLFVLIHRGAPGTIRHHYRRDKLDLLSIRSIG